MSKIKRDRYRQRAKHRDKDRDRDIEQQRERKKDTERKREKNSGREKRKTMTYQINNYVSQKIICTILSIFNKHHITLNLNLNQAT
jgi:hypothetical protein